jgi:hypothetical protein
MADDECGIDDDCGICPCYKWDCEHYCLLDGKVLTKLVQFSTCQTYIQYKKDLGGDKKGNGVIVNLLEYAILKYLITHAVKFEFDLPPSDIYMKRVFIEKRAKNTWTITTDYATCWNFKEKEFVFDPLPSNRSEQFIEETRFKTLEEAYDLIQKWIDILKEKKEMKWISTV